MIQAMRLALNLSREKSPKRQDNGSVGWNGEGTHSTCTTSLKAATLAPHP